MKQRGIGRQQPGGATSSSPRSSDSSQLAAVLAGCGIYRSSRQGGRQVRPRSRQSLPSLSDWCALVQAHTTLQGPLAAHMEWTHAQCMELVLQSS